jgi:hypothetical protein
LLALLAWYELHEKHYAAVAVVWAAGGLLLGLMGRRLAKRDLTYQANAAALAAFLRVWFVNYDATETYHQFTLRLVTVSSVSVLFYISSHWSWVAEADVRIAIAHKRISSAIYTWAGTLLLAALAWYEVQFAAVAVVWILGSLVLALVGRRLANPDLTYQSNALALAAFVRTVLVNYSAIQPFHQFTQRLVSVMLVAVLLYVSTRWAWVEESGDRDFFLGGYTFAFKKIVSSIYVWAGSFLLALLAWYELSTVSVTVAWAAGGLVLLEMGLVRKSVAFRSQAYVAFISAFLWMFFSNLNAGGEGISPRLYTVMPIALIFFYAYWQLLENKSQLFPIEQRLQIAEFCCWLGAISIVALVRFELQPDWVATGWAALALVMICTAWLSAKRLFLHQALLLSFGILFRSVLHNFYQRSYFPPVTAWQTRWVLVGSTVVLMFLALPVLFRLRSKEQINASALRRVLSVLDHHPEQLFFFIAVGLLSVMLALEMRRGMITLSWGIEGLAIFVIALFAAERSFRLTGLGLLLLCVAKILFKDVWLLQPSDRYMTLIVLGIALLLVSFLYTRYQETIRQYL